MLFEKLIPRRERGTAATLQMMAELAWAGQDVPLAAMMRPEGLDGVLRDLWFYVPDGRVETIRTIDRMYRDFNQALDCIVDGQYYGQKPPGAIAGDCDDAATLAAAVLIHARRLGDPDVAGPIQFVAARPAHSHEFGHVFVTFNFRGQPTRVDPTAPAGTDYRNWETMVFNF